MGMTDDVVEKEIIILARLVLAERHFDNVGPGLYFGPTKRAIHCRPLGRV